MFLIFTIQVRLQDMLMDSITNKRPRSESRSKSPNDFSQVWDPRSQKFVMQRKLSDSADNFFVPPMPNPISSESRHHEFQVLSVSDINRYESAVQLQIGNQWNQMESQMEARMELSASQRSMMQEEFRAELSHTVGYCRQEYMNVQEEARRHQSYWVAECQQLHSTATDMRSFLLSECADRENQITGIGQKHTNEYRTATSLHNQLQSCKRTSTCHN